MVNKYDDLSAELAATKARLAEAQAEIDRLMLEFCPSEMDEEQMANWAAHQRAAVSASGVNK
jgi:hypothetical protein